MMFRFWADFNKNFFGTKTPFWAFWPPSPLKIARRPYFHKVLANFVKFFFGAQNPFLGLFTTPFLQNCPLTVFSRNFWPILTKFFWGGLKPLSGPLDHPLPSKLPPGLIFTDFWPILTKKNLGPETPSLAFWPLPLFKIVCRQYFHGFLADFNKFYFRGPKPLSGPFDHPLPSKLPAGCIFTDFWPILTKKNQGQKTLSGPFDHPLLSKLLAGHFRTWKKNWLKIFQNMA